MRRHLKFSGGTSNDLHRPYFPRKTEACLILKVAIHQPNYAPWCGFFAKMNACDVFVFYDDAQMTKNSYINRCLINNQGRQTWLTIPVSFKLGDKINQVIISDDRWKHKHMQTLRSVYGRTPFFKEVFGLIEPIYLNTGNSLSQLNMNLIRVVAAFLELSCQFELSSSIPSDNSSDDRLIDICRALGAGNYISGKGGDNYQDHNKFKTAGINLVVKTYTPMPYDQKNDSFLPGLSILDALFHVGKNAVDLLAYEQKESVLP